MGHGGWIVVAERVFADEMIRHAAEITFDVMTGDGRHGADFDGMIKGDETEIGDGCGRKKRFDGRKRRREGSGALSFGTG